MVEFQKIDRVGAEINQTRLFTKGTQDENHYEIQSLSFYSVLETEKCLLGTYKHIKETPFEGFTSPIIARSISSDFVYLNLLVYGFTDNLDFIYHRIVQ